MDSIVSGKYALPPQLKSVQALSGFRVHLVFADGVEREIDLEPCLRGPIFDPSRADPKLFAAVQIDEVGDTICWPNGADIAPEILYYRGKPPWIKKTKVSIPPRRVLKHRIAKSTSHRKTKTRALVAKPKRQSM